MTNSSDRQNSSLVPIKANETTMKSNIKSSIERKNSSGFSRLRPISGTTTASCAYSEGKSNSKAAQHFKKDIKASSTTKDRVGSFSKTSSSDSNGRRVQNQRAISPATGTGNYSRKKSHHNATGDDPSDAMVKLNNKMNNCTIKKANGLVGLENLGNTCFMNCILQCLSNIPLLMEYFVEGKYNSHFNNSSKTKGKLADAFGELIKTLWKSPAFSSTRPNEVKRLLGKLNSQFAGFEQHDAQELLRALLDGLHEDLNLITKKPAYYEIKDRPNAKDVDVSREYWKYYNDRNKSKISELFCGQILSEIICQTCSHRSICFDVVWDLSLPLPKKSKNRFNVFSRNGNSGSSSPRGLSVEDCLKMYTEEELVADSYYCSKCKSHQTVLKKLLINRLPQILVLHFKRFSSMSGGKINTSIKIPVSGLNVENFCSKEAVCKTSSIYDLTGVAHHMGGLNGGHYTADCLNKDNSQWYDFNDSNVSLLKNSEAEAFNSGNAYVLFYQRRNLKKPHAP